MVSIGVDQSYKSTGICVIDDSLQILHLGKFTSDTSKDVYDRATEIATHLAEVTTTHSVQSFNIEGLAFGMVGDATRDLAGLIFVIITTMRRLHPTIPVYIHPPTSVKKSATGSGKATKVEMFDALPASVRSLIAEKNLRKTTGAYDVCDAYWISRMGIKSLDIAT